MFTFIATAFAAYFAYRAAHATHKGALADEANAQTADATLRDMQTNAGRQLRAYIAISNVKVEQASAHNKVVVAFDQKNWGQTPATNYSLWTKIAVEALGWNDFDRDTAEEPPRVLNPGDTNTTFVESDFDLSDKQEKDIREARTRIFMWGEVTFVDAFGYDRFVRFRLEYGDSRTRKAGRMGISRGGNEAN